MEQWSHTEKTDKSAIQEHKLRVVYIAAEDGANGIPEENEDMEQSRIEESVSVSFVICAHIRVCLWSGSDLTYAPSCFNLLSSSIFCSLVGQCSPRWTWEMDDGKGEAA